MSKQEKEAAELKKELEERKAELAKLEALASARAKLEGEAGEL